MQNQHRKDISQELSILRQEIDEIDNQIINLLNKRIGVVARVGILKESHQERFFIKSAREADMIKNLVDKVENPILKLAVIQIWRKIITCSNMLEQEIKIAFYNPDRKFNNLRHLICDYYADFVSIHDYSSSTNLICEIEKNSSQIAVFPLPLQQTNSKNDSDYWWINIANNKSGLKVFAKIPFIQKGSESFDSSLVALAIKDPEKSKSDQSLFVVELQDQFNSNDLIKIFNKEEIEVNIIAQAKIKDVGNITFYLLEVEGFFLSCDEKIESLSKSQIKPHIKLIGNYPKSIIL